MRHRTVPLTPVVARVPAGAPVIAFEGAVRQPAT